MTNKCSVDGANINMCPALAEVTQGEIGDIKTQTRFRISDEKVRVAVFAGRFKKNMVELNYCPFCGGDIWTKYGVEEPVQVTTEPQVSPTSVKIYDQLLGLTFSSVKQDSNDDLAFECEDGKLFTFTHIQDCCEDVQIEDICGDLQDLVGSPLLQAEEVTYSDVNPNGVPSKDYQDSFTWTFYKFATIKGSVTVRWYGASNGYYSELVSLHESEVAK